MGSWDTADGVVEFPDGRRLRGAALRRPYRGVIRPEYAVYLLGKDPGYQGWPYRWVRWRDFRVPDSAVEAVTALREAYTRAEFERVEIACRGGVGRTGTALAFLVADITGSEPDDAIAWVRARYHARAVETRGQRRWVSNAAAR